MKFVSMRELETPRLTLRKIRMEDLPEYHSRLTCDPQVARAMLWEATSDISHTQGNIIRIQEGYRTGTRWHWAITRKEDGFLIGTIALVGFDLEADSASFAYMLGRAYWNRGYATEALGAVLRFAFEEMEVGSILADHFVENPASGAVMEKSGMRRMGVLSEKYEKTGIAHDAVQYGIKRADWLKKKRHG